jgi:hypothetical protein
MAAMMSALSIGSASVASTAPLDPTGLPPVARLIVLAALVAALVVLLRWWWLNRRR